VLTLMLVFLPLPTAAWPASAADCKFVLGFKALYDLIPDLAGNCTASQRYNSLNGDALQETTKGLLVWRKADNFTAFTDGYRSWVNGPNGLQQRLNTERFEWEAQANSCSASAGDVTFGRFVGNNVGSAVSEGSIHNPCGYQLNAVIDVFAASSRDGPAIMDGPSIFVTDLAPGETRALTASVPNSISATWFTWRLTNIDLSRQEGSCPDGERCFSVDALLASALSDLRRVKDGEWLLRVAEDNGVQIRRGKTPAGILGGYNSKTKTITIDSRLDAYSSWVRAAVLAHELQHAAEDAAGQSPGTAASCYRAEESAFRRMAQVWNGLWQERLPMVGDALHWELNEVSIVVERDPARFTTSLVERYKNQCGD